MKKIRDLAFGVISWIAMVVLTCTSIPQIILNFQRGSVEGLSWPMFGMLLFGMGIMFIRALATKADLLIRLNFGIGTFLVLIVNLQIIFYRFIC